MNTEPFEVYLRGRAPQTVMAYMTGPFAVHRPARSKSGWIISYGGLKFPGTFHTRGDALAAARLLDLAYSEGWDLQRVKEEGHRLEAELQVGWRAVGVIPPEAAWVQRYDDYLDCVWMTGREDIEWPSWVFSD
jgi:hypothetical protein